jgi:hypothetical protein
MNILRIRIGSLLDVRDHRKYLPLAHRRRFCLVTYHKSIGFAHRDNSVLCLARVIEYDQKNVLHIYINICLMMILLDPLHVLLVVLVNHLVLSYGFHVLPRSFTLGEGMVLAQGISFLIIDTIFYSAQTVRTESQRVICMWCVSVSSSVHDRFLKLFISSRLCVCVLP